MKQCWMYRDREDPNGSKLKPVWRSLFFFHCGNKSGRSAERAGQVSSVWWRLEHCSEKSHSGFSCDVRALAVAAVTAVTVVPSVWEAS